MKFSFEIKTVPGGVREINLFGKILIPEDFTPLKEKIDELLELKNRKFILNLEEVEQMNSSGLNLIINLLTKIRNKGGELLIIHAEGSVRKLFEISKLTKVFKIYNSKEEAVNELNKLNNE